MYTEQMKMKMAFFACCLMLSLNIGHARADAAVDNALLSRIDLQAQSSREIGNDLMQATLSLQREDKNPARLAQEINDAMRWALDTAGMVKEVTVKSGNYQTEPVYQTKNQITTVSHWRATQQILLESRNAIAMSHLIGQLQARLQIESMGFSVSPEKRREEENNLIATALNAFKIRAEIVRKNLDAPAYRVMHLSINTSDNEYTAPRFARAATMEVSSTPAVTAGTTRVTVNVSGTIQLQP